MKYNPEEDGITHINVYSKGKTELGRLLSNFADTPFKHPSLGYFRTVEGYWYYIVTGQERFRTMLGWEAKSEGKKSLSIREHPDQEELLEAYTAKLNYNPKIKEMLLSCNLPLTHYYIYNNVVKTTQWLWTATLWDNFR